MFTFSWDPLETTRKVRKNDITFDEALSVFADELALTFTDTDYVRSDRYSRTYGISNRHRPLVVVHADRRNGLKIIGVRKANSYEMICMKKCNQDILEIKYEFLKVGTRAKYLKCVGNGGNVIALAPELQKAFPTSEAVNKALATVLKIAQQTQNLAVPPKKLVRRKRESA